jgi:hypothetical protein
MDHDGQQLKDNCATWKSEVESQVYRLSRDSKDSKLTLVLCLSPSAYGRALSKYSTGPFTKEEWDLVQKFSPSRKSVMSGPGNRLFGSNPQKPDTRPPSHTVKDYKPGHDYDSEPEMCFKPDVNDDSGQASQ